MPIWLKPHAANAAPAIRIRVDVGRRDSGERLLVNFRVIGDLAGLMWQGECESGRRDGLWQHGCFEAFVATGDGSYIELNMAPTARWAAYRFDSYRAGMIDAEASVYRQDWYRRKLSVPRLELHAGWLMPVDLVDRTWQVGLSAVIEATNSTKSYWALAHAPGPPDFHNPACFTATLPPPTRA